MLWNKPKLLELTQGWGNYVINESQCTISEPRRKNEDTEEAQRRRKQRAKKRKQQMQKKIEENKVPQWCMKSII